MLHFRLHSRYAKTWTSNFRKVVQQHTEGMLERIMRILLEIYFASQQWKNFENPLRIQTVVVLSLVYYFFGTRYIFPITAHSSYHCWLIYCFSSWAFCHLPIIYACAYLMLRCYWSNHRMCKLEEVQLSQRDRAPFRVIACFAKSLRSLKVNPINQST